MKLIAIVAHDPNRLIGSGGDLPWHLPADLAFFKKTTSEHAIVMGRKTYQSIGRPLPRRQNIVVTRDREWEAEGVTTIHSPDELTKIQIERPEPIFIIGGAEIYRHFLPHLDELLVSKVKKSYQGDTHFPAYDDLFQEEETLLDEEDFSVVRLIRKPL